MVLHGKKKIMFNFNTTSQQNVSQSVGLLGSVVWGFLSDFFFF